MLIMFQDTKIENNSSVLNKVSLTLFGLINCLNRPHNHNTIPNLIWPDSANETWPYNHKPAPHDRCSTLNVINQIFMLLWFNFQRQSRTKEEFINKRNKLYIMRDSAEKSKKPSNVFYVLFEMIIQRIKINSYS